MGRHHYVALLQALRDLTDYDKNPADAIARINLSALDLAAALHADPDLLNTGLRDHVAATCEHLLDEARDGNF